MKKGLLHKKPKSGQPRKKIKDKWLTLPLIKKSEKEIKSFLDIEAQKAKQQEVIWRRVIHSNYNLNKSAKLKLIDQLRRTKILLVNYVVASERLRKLLELSEQEDLVKENA